MCSFGIPNSIDAICERQLAQWPRGHASFRLFREIQFDEIVTMPPEPIALGANDHTWSDRGRTGGGSSRLPIDFADTEPTGAKGSELM
jgi:hypothetical protein